MIHKYFATALNNKEVYQAICIEHKQLEENFKKIFDDAVAAPPQAQTTASSLI
jgi:shikimate 5-dehydrogenase